MLFSRIFVNMGYDGEFSAFYCSKSVNCVYTSKFPIKSLYWILLQITSRHIINVLDKLCRNGNDLDICHLIFRNSNDIFPWFSKRTVSLLFGIRILHHCFTSIFSFYPGYPGLFLLCLFDLVPLSVFWACALGLI